MIWPEFNDLKLSSDLCWNKFASGKMLWSDLAFLLQIGKNKQQKTVRGTDPFSYSPSKPLTDEASIETMKKNRSISTCDMVSLGLWFGFWDACAHWNTHIWSSPTPACSCSLAAGVQALPLLLVAHTVLAQPLCCADSLGLTPGSTNPCADPSKEQGDGAAPRKDLCLWESGEEEGHRKILMSLSSYHLPSDSISLCTLRPTCRVL